MKEKIINQAILLGAASIQAFQDYETKQRKFNQFIKRNKLND